MFNLELTTRPHEFNQTKTFTNVKILKIDTDRIVYTYTKGMNISPFTVFLNQESIDKLNVEVGKVYTVYTVKKEKVWDWIKADIAQRRTE